MSSQNCPTREQLSGYVEGRLPDDLVEAVAEHVETCAICDATVEELERQSDSPFQALRDPVPPLVGLDSPQYKRALKTAEAAGLDDASLSPPAVEGVSLFALGQLGEYELLGRIGRGGMGAVYKARQVRLDKTVALKVLPRERTSDLRAVARFEREMKAIGRLSNPNIVQALDARDIDGTTVLVMEYVEGLDLAKVLRRVGRFAIADACELIRQTALGLQYIHENKLVHRDVKPSNLMLTPQGQVKILDLGLALLNSHESTDGELTGDGSVMGTPDYIAPEQAGDCHGVDIRADIYSLGCTLYHLLTGCAPFGGPNYRKPLDKVMGHTRDTAPAVKVLRPDVPNVLSAIVERMMAKDPVSRFVAPAEAATALSPFVAGSDLPALLAKATTSRRADSERSTIAVSSLASPILGTTVTVTPSPRPTTGSLQGDPDAVDHPSVPMKSSPWWRGRSFRLTIAAVVPVLIVLGMTIHVVTNKGTLVLTVNVPDAQVTINGTRMRIKTPRDEIALRVGDHEIEVSKEGFTTTTHHFTIERGSRTELTANLTSVSTRASTTSVALPQTPTSTYLALSRDGSELLIPTAIPNGKNSGLVYIINTATLKHVGEIRCGEGPRGIAISPDGTRGCITNTLDGFHTTLFDPVSKIVTRTISTGVDSSGVAFTPDGDRVWLAHDWSDHLAVVDVVSGKMYGIRGIDSGRRTSVAALKRNSRTEGAHDLAITPDGRFVYVAGRTGDIYKIDTEKRSIARTIKNELGGYGATCIRVSPDGKHFCVTSEEDQKLHTFSTRDDSEVWSLALPAYGLCFSQDGRFVFATVPERDEVVAISCDTHKIVKTYRADEPVAVLASLDGKRLYVASRKPPAIAVVDIGLVGGPSESERTDIPNSR